MDKVVSTSKSIGTYVLVILYTLCIYGAGFTAGWYKGVSDTLVPMFFEQTQQVANATNSAPPRPTSPIQFPQNSKSPSDTKEK